MKKILSTLVSGALIASGLVLLPQPAQAAPPGSAFDPGLIISDSVFFDFGTMTVEEIQRFLDSRVSDCRATDPAIDCLKNAKFEIPETPATGPTEVGPCAAIPANPQASAAQVIHAIATACGINPRVLIVTLQKEQGLVTSTKPTDYMYRAAMGFGCPDSDPAICGKVYVGLFNQMYRAAKQFRWYGNPEGSFTYWKPGRVISMRFNPRASCGSKSFLLKNQATANLYYYTPYTPNDAALRNLYGTGDSCSAYGNRNFWRFYHDWFGSPIGGGYLLKSETSGNYLIVNNQRYLVTDPKLLASLDPLGPLGEISQAYLDSFQEAGTMGHMVVDSASNTRYVLAGSKKYEVTECSIAAEYGLDCNAAISLLPLQLDNFPSGGQLSRLTAVGGAQYWVEDGKYRLVVDPLALNTVGGQSERQIDLNVEQVATLTPGAPLASELATFALTGSKDVLVASGGKTYRFVSSLASATNLQRWFTATGATVEAAVIAPSLHPELIRGFVASASGGAFVITPDGKLPIKDPANWTGSFVVVPESLLNAIPTVQGELSTPVMVSSPGNKLSYFINGNARRSSTSTDMTNRFLSVLMQDKVVMIPQAAINSLLNAGIAIAPGSIVKQGTSHFLADGIGNLVRLESLSHAQSVSSSKVFTFRSADLASFQVRPRLNSLKVQCAGGEYLLDKGTLHRISSSSIAEFPGAAYPLATSTCSSFQLADREVGPFIRDNRGLLFYIEDGKKRRVSNWAHLAKLRGEGPGHIETSAYFASKIPTGATAPQSVTLPTGGTVPSGEFGDLVFGGVVPTPSPTPSPTQTATPTPTPTQTATATPTPTQSANPATYRVVSGDTLSGIARRFGVSVSSIQQLNNMGSSTTIRVGQVLQIPSTTSATPSPTPTPTQSPTPTPSPSPTPSPTPTSSTYTVKSGDTLLKIATSFGVTVSSIQQLNNMGSSTTIRVGQVLRIPSSGSTATPSPTPTQRTYTVKSGDTLIGIARRFSVTVSALSSLNGITNANSIRVGQVLKIPG
jgi:LysM repeat protein